MEQEKYSGERRKLKKKQGAWENEKGARKKAKRSKGQKTERIRERGDLKGAKSIDPPNRGSRL